MIAKSIRTFLLIMAASTCGPSAVAQTPAVAAQSDAVRGGALELAQLLNPPEPLIAIAGRSFDEAFDKGMTAEGSEALEKAYPGMVAELRRAAREITLADLRSDIPAMHRRYARFFEEQFTQEELTALIAFYRTSTGTKIIQAKFANIDVSRLTDRFVEDSDAKLSAADVNALNRGAMPGVFKEMSAADIRALMAFGLSPVGKKLRSVTPQMAQLEAEIANEPDPKLDAAIEAASRKVYQRFGLDDAAGDR
jgi:hypothetical protein